ncbi:HpcH/HpaI aldolase/citrate lyase family protein [Dysosmobacter sp.]
MRRTMLFLPGNQPRMLMNGGLLGADSIIFDLEDAVAPDEKDAARHLVRNALKTLSFGTCEIIVRINALDTPFWEEDLREMLPLRPAVIMPTKVSGAGYIHTLEEKMTAIETAAGMEAGCTRIIPLLETAAGIENSFEIAGASRRMAALYLGAEDLTADLHCKRTKEGGEIAYARGRMVMAARAAGIEAYDTPFTDVEDMEGLRADALYAKSLGYTGKAVISPRHVDCVNEVFSPTAREIHDAQEVLRAIEQGKAQGKGAVSLHGKMIDAPIVERAKNVLKAAEDLGVLIHE